MRNGKLIAALPLSGWFFSWAVILQILAFSPALALASPFSGNTIDDLFEIKKIEGKQATLEGHPKALKIGDILYFARSPFKFTITAVKGNQVTIALPEKNDLAVGQNLMRNATEQVRHALDTEKRLKQALEE